MPSNTTRTIGILALLSLVIATIAAAPLAAQETQRFTVPLSRPGDPLVLHAQLLYGGISVEGHDGDDVTVEVIAEEPERQGRNVGGMRASLYNAFPSEGVDKLIDVMREFENEYA